MYSHSNKEQIHSVPYTWIVLSADIKLRKKNRENGPGGECWLSDSGRERERREERDGDSG